METEHNVVDQDESANKSKNKVTHEAPVAASSSDHVSHALHAAREKPRSTVEVCVLSYKTFSVNVNRLLVYTTCMAIIKVTQCDCLSQNHAIHSMNNIF